MTFTEAERALDAGRLEMATPWGDWVLARRNGRTNKRAGRQHLSIEILMEAQVAARLSTAQDRLGQQYIRVRK